MPNLLIYIPYTLVCMLFWVAMAAQLPNWLSVLLMAMVAPYIFVTVEYFIYGKIK